MEGPPPNPNDNNGPLIVTVAIVGMCVSGLAVVCRFISRKLIKQPFLLDDWIIVLAIPFSWSVAIIQIRGVAIGAYGRHIEYVPPTSIIPFFQLLYSLQIVYLFSIFFIKTSILLFYRRIFSIPQTRIPAIVIAVILVAWLFATLPPAIWACKPLYGFWERAVNPECINNVQYYIGITVPNLVTDAALLLFPVPLIWNLRVSLQKKLSLLIIFLLAGFVILVSIIRMVVLARANGDPDVTWALSDLGVWTVVETNIGILLACLPSLLPILRLVLGQKTRSSADEGRDSDLSASANSRKVWPSNWKSRKNSLSFSRLNDCKDTELNSVSCGPSVSVYRTTSDLKDEFPEVTPPRGIYVKRDIEWSQDDDQRGQN